jgi:hypothetical protein
MPMAKPTTFNPKGGSVKFGRDTDFNFGANVKPRKPKAGGKAKKGGKGGGS